MPVLASARVPAGANEQYRTGPLRVEGPPAVHFHQRVGLARSVPWQSKLAEFLPQ
ncbi:hypothetical protein CBOM_04351 [Ceraceosorus bombacis]|uniref:Uncharacterized protein n=1 Tax=Ceraceosorus bombacis TaxID=401625 RepID=A0A0P1BHD9_9BASI|nr:hypothetical protein CBOM_04351 [Ceraceosorus bombacis]